MHFSFILRCWITANGGLRGYLVELPSRLKHPFTEEEELVETVYRLTTTYSSARDAAEEQ